MLPSLLRVTPAATQAVRWLLVLSPRLHLYLPSFPPHVPSSTLSGKPLASRMSFLPSTPIPHHPRRLLLALMIRYPNTIQRIRTSCLMLKILRFQSPNRPDFIDVFMPPVDMSRVGHLAFAYPYPPLQTQQKLLEVSFANMLVILGSL